MLDWLILMFNSIQSNAIVAGIFGTTVFAGLAVYLRSLPGKVFQFILNFLTMLIIFEQQQKVSSDMYGNDFRINKIYTAMCRKLATMKRFSFSKTEDCINDCVDESNDKYNSTVSFVGATGNTYWSIINGILISYSVREIQSQQRVRTFSLNVRFYTRNRNKVYSIINEVLYEEIVKDKKTGIPYHFNTAGANWVDMIKKYQFSQNVLMLTSMQQSIYARISMFLNSEHKYRQLCKPYHIGFIFHGYPGCGKSQFIKKLAEDFELPIYVLNFGSVTTDAQLISLIRQIEDQHAIVLIEDVDRFRFTGENKQSEDQKSGFHASNQFIDTDNGVLSKDFDPEIDPSMAELFGSLDDLANNGGIVGQESNGSSGTIGKTPSFSTVLNILDGIYGTDNGLIFIATTNHFSTLDPAFIRPGRFDYKYEFGYMNAKDICNFIKFQFNVINKTPIGDIPDVRLDKDLVLPISVVSNVCFESANVNDCITKLNKLYKG